MKKIIIEQKLTDNEVETYCEKHNKNLIMVTYKDNATTLLVADK